LLWGGIRNPIIPVGAKDDAAADAFLKKFQVDVLFPVAESDRIKQFLERCLDLVHPNLSARKLLYEDWNGARVSCGLSKWTTREGDRGQRY